MGVSSAMVVGGDGLIGSALTTQLRGAGWNVVSTSRRKAVPTGCLHFDLAHGVGSLPKLPVHPQQVVFICAAVTGFATCANDPEGSRDINVTRTVELGDYFMQQGALVVYLSSNAVFDGTQVWVNENAPRSPTSEYGRQKAESEAKLLAAAADLPGACAVVRLTKVVGWAQPLYRAWVHNFESHEPARAAADLVMCPVTIGYVVNGLQCIGAGMQGGVYHLSGECDLTYFELAQAMANAWGRGATVEQDWVRQRLGAVPSPAHSALSMAGTTAFWGLKPQPLEMVARELTGQK